MRPQTPWLPLAKNPYGEAVEERAGVRRCTAPQGWLEEPHAKGASVCRVAAPGDVDLAMRSMAVPEISASFGHRAIRAYAVWSTAVGQPTRLTPEALKTIEQEGRPGWRRFERGVTRALGDAANRAWAAHRADAAGVPRWSRTLASPSATAWRGVQWGLARRLERESQLCRSGVWFEWGLVEPEDAATRRLRPEARRLRASRLGQDPLSPFFDRSPRIPRAPRSFSGGHFGAAPAAAEPDSAIPVIWCTGSSRAVWGEKGWDEWWAWLATPGRAAWVVLDASSVTALQALRQSLGRRTDWCVWRVGDASAPLAWICQAGPGITGGVRSCSLEEWAGSPDALLPDSPPQEHWDGRVPYRALSRVGTPEGCAPVRLEAAQHQALLDAAHVLPDPDRWVAEGLGVEPDRLGELLSPEQVDAVVLGRRALEGGVGFLVADATGFGKGRVLAALAITGLRQGRAVAFFTENAPLFSDFFRDLSAVSPNWLPRPHLLHQDATVRLPNGTVWARSLTEKPFQEWLRQPSWEETDDRFLMTTYAQVARSASKGRASWLRHRIGETGWVLLDEAHNAAGDSLAAQQIERVFEGRSVVFASATFARHEGNLDLYRPALPLGPGILRLMQRALTGEAGVLREVLTEAMARAGRLVRREHSPIPPPRPVWVPLTAERAAAVSAFESAWRLLFEVGEDVEREQGSAAQFAWLRLGAILSRSVREFSLLLKRDVIVDVIRERCAAGQKVVVAVDSTFEAALREAALGVDPAAEDEEGGAAEDSPPQTKTSKKKTKPRRTVWPAAPRWKDRWHLLLQAIAADGYWLQGNPHTAADRERRWRAAAAAIAALPDWDLSPLDHVQRALTQHGLRVTELSGRDLVLRAGPEGWEAASRPKTDRAGEVAAFNRGEKDVIFITRAGSTGISLHAGRAFADQRVRCLVEWDIAPNPVHRVQFWGRVRRKDQVVEPEFLGLQLDTPSDRRILERETRKHARLSAHMGGRLAESLGWVSPEGEAIVAEWAADHPASARRLGIAAPVPDQPTARVDRALLRSMVLPASERAALIGRLERGLDVARDWALRARHEPTDAPSRAVRRAWWWGDDEAPFGSLGDAAGVPRVDVVERVWCPAEAVSVDPWGTPWGEPGSAVLAAWLAAWRADAAAGVVTSDRRRAVWAAANRWLPALEPGRGLFLTSPDTGHGVRGIVLGVEGPRSADGAAWSLSQVAVRVWLVGDAAPQTVSLASCASDPVFRVSTESARPEWFSAPPVARRALCMEGNPLAAAAWGRRWGVGRSALVRDAERGEQAVWLLPSTWTWDRVWALDRDLVDVEHAVLFLKSHPDSSLSAALPLPQRLHLDPSPEGARFRFAAATHAAASRSWLGYALERRLGRPQRAVGAEGEEVVYRIRWPQLRGCLHSFEAAGVFWRMSAGFEPWYRATSRDRCRTAPTPPRRQSGVMG